MAKANWDAQPIGLTTSIPFDDLSEAEKALLSKAMRAALRALAECELPAQMEIENGGLMHTRSFGFDRNFRLVIRALSEEGKAE